MFNKVQKMIEEQKLNNSTETAILPIQCYMLAAVIYRKTQIEALNKKN